MSKVQILLIAVVVLVVGAILGFIFGRSGGADLNTTVEIKTAVTKDIYDPASYKKLYPLEYNSYMEASKFPDGRDKPGEFGGDKMFDHKLRQVGLPVLFANNAFSKDYKDDRGHVYAVPDLYDTLRVNRDDTQPSATKGACITCKTPYLEQLYSDYPGNGGWDYAKQPFVDIEAKVPRDHASINCATCHDPATMELRVINKALIEAYAKLDDGFDLTAEAVNKPSKQDMRSLVCAQCHVEYYFEPGTYKVVFPWTDGWKPQEAYQYYEKLRNGDNTLFKRDFVHGVSETLILKAQHPDYETWITGTHGRAGVTCADCHMPFMTENGVKYSTHDVTSPLRTVEESCMTCHTQDKDWLTESVLTVQDNFWFNQHEAESAVVELHNTIKAAMDSGVDGDLIQKAQLAAREAQWYWDFLAAENSMGFHNPDQGMQVAMEAVVIAKSMTVELTKAMR
ncbi:MAG: ammonia-forming cytochrome c nitrite reductase subunit c552 [Peptococcaceae bacterium]|nr:ammonia-forming cytochrome c nitrite reductase subunit c552 [Peptococcaceae bacterium]